MSSDATSVLIRANHVIPVASALLTNGWIVVEGGRIQAIGAGRGPATDRLIDYGESALMPGFINAHTHVGCSCLKGISEGSSFASWISECVAPVIIRNVRDDPAAVRAAAADAVNELIGGGVTTVAESFFDTVGRDAILESGLRGVFFREHFGSMSDSMRAATDGAKEQVSRDASELMDNPMMGLGLAPHAPYTCPRAVLEVLATEAGNRDLLQTIHVAESPEEREFFCNASGPFMDMFAGGDRADRFALGQSPVRALQESGSLGPSTLAVHCVQVDAPDMEILCDTKTHVVHCPGSNLRLGVGVAPVSEMVRIGINVSLGTDSAASNGKLDLFEEMRLAVLLQRGQRRDVSALQPAVALRMATLNGARALGLAEETGSLEQGKAADLCVVALDRPRHRPMRDPVTAVVMSAIADDVRATWVRGQLVFSRDEQR